MNVEQKPRQVSLLDFFDYLTLACMSFALVRRAFEVAPSAAVPLSAVMFAAAGTSLGSLFGRPGAGAAIGFVLSLIAFCTVFG